MITHAQPCLGRARGQAGIALATALIFLVVITILGLVAMRSSTTELQLARNQQNRVEAMETAQAVVDAVIADDTNTPVTTNPDYLRCFDSGDAGGQDQCPGADSGLVLGPTTDNGVDSIFQHGIYAEVRRLDPAESPVPATFMTSMDKFTTASFAVRGQYARGAAGLGAADIEQGLLKLVPKSARIQ